MNGLLGISITRRRFPSKINCTVLIEMHTWTQYKCMSLIVGLFESMQLNVKTHQLKSGVHKTILKWHLLEVWS